MKDDVKNKEASLLLYASATLTGYYSGYVPFKNSTSFYLDVESP